MFRQGFRHARRFAGAAGMNMNNQHFQPNFQAKLPQFRLETTSLAISSPHSSIMQIVQNSGLASLLEAVEGEDDDAECCQNNKNGKCLEKCDFQKFFGFILGIFTFSFP